MLTRKVLSNIKLLAKMSYYLLKISLRYPINFVADFAELALWIMVFYLPILLFLPKSGDFAGVSPALFTLWGFFIYLFISDTIWTIAGGLRYDQITGILEQNFLTPINEFLYPLARLIRIFIRDFPIMLTFPIIFWVVTGEFLAKNIPLALYILAISIIGLIGFGYLYAGFVISMKRSAMSANVIQFIVMIFSAVFYPFRSLPESMLVISKLLPFSYYIDLFRTTMIGIEPELIEKEIIIGNIILTPFWTELIIIHVLSIIFLVIGLLTYKVMVMRAKKLGTLHMY